MKITLESRVFGKMPKSELIMLHLTDGEHFEGRDHPMAKEITLTKQRFQKNKLRIFLLEERKRTHPNKNSLKTRKEFLIHQSDTCLGLNSLRFLNNELNQGPRKPRNQPQSLIVQSRVNGIPCSLYQTKNNCVLLSYQRVPHRAKV